jgi:NAD(P)-dependent dehydrogenase (short-subunit alcohol dehydrogenase family)
VHTQVGLGFEAALKFAQCDADRVVLAVRSIAKGEQAQKEIERRTGRKGCISVWKLDMADYASIQAFAKRADTELDHLDIAVLNAGEYFHLTIERDIR